jgi:hypothetical protein
VIVTGVSSGIAEATAKLLGKHGANLPSDTTGCVIFLGAGSVNSANR